MSAFDEINVDALCGFDSLEEDADIERSETFSALKNNGFRLQGDEIIGDYETLKNKILQLEDELKEAYKISYECIHVESCNFENIRGLYKVTYRHNYDYEVTWYLHEKFLEFLIKNKYDISFIDDMKKIEDYRFSTERKKRVIFNLKLEIDSINGNVKYTIITDDPDL